MLHSHKQIGQFLRYVRFVDREVTMLELSRKQQESLTISTPMGEIIQISILDTTPDTTMLGIDAPSESIILREDSSGH